MSLARPTEAWALMPATPGMRLTSGAAKGTYSSSEPSGAQNIPATKDMQLQLVCHIASGVVHIRLHTFGCRGGACMRPQLSMFASHGVLPPKSAVANIMYEMERTCVKTRAMCEGTSNHISPPHHSAIKCCVQQLPYTQSI